jgi:hypothetical protein
VCGGKIIFGQSTNGPLLTLGQATRPPAIVLARNNRLTLHHVLGVAVELDHVTSSIGRVSLGVAILWCARMGALDLCAII